MQNLGQERTITSINIVRLESMRRLTCEVQAAPALDLSHPYGSKQTPHTASPDSASNSCYFKFLMSASSHIF